MIRERDLEFSTQASAATREYLGLSGKNAMEGRAGFGQRLEAMRENVAAGIDDPDFAGRLRQSAARAAAAAMERADAHLAGERRTYDESLMTARIGGAVDDALAFPRDASALARAQAVIQAETANLGRMAGAPPEAVEQQRRDLSGKLYRQSIMALVDVDPEQAAALLKAHGGDMDQNNRRVLAGLVNEAMDARGAESAYQRIANGRAPSGGKDARLLDAVRGWATAEESGAAGYRAVNRASGAFGRYQFMPNTWNQYADQLGLPRMTKALSLAGDLPSVADQEKAFEALTLDNAESLKRAGVTVTPGALALAHGFGVGAVARMMDAPPDADAGEWVMANADIWGGGEARARAIVRQNRMAGTTMGKWQRRAASASAAPDGAETAPAGAPTSYAEQLRLVEEIGDPEQREAVRKLINSRHQDRQRVEAESREARLTAAYEHVEGGGTIRSMTTADRVALGADLEKVEAYEATLRGEASGEKTKTDLDVWADLERLRSEDPAAFARLDLRAARPSLSEAHWRGFYEKQQAILNRQPVKIDAAMSDVDPLLRAADIHKPTTSTDDPNNGRYVAFQDAFEQALNAEQAATGRDPDQRRAREIAGRLLRRVVTDSWMPFDQRTRLLFEADDAALADPNLQIPADIRAEIEAAFRAAGVTPTEPQILDAYRAYLREN
jgi:hypothetical protein